MPEISGNKISQKILTDVNQRLSSIPKKITLDIILASDDQSARTYTNLKKSKAKEVGIECNIHEFTSESTASEIISKIEQLRANSSGIMVQLPLFDHLTPEQSEIINSIPPKLDVDGMTSATLGRIGQGNLNILPATVDAILECLRHISNGNLSDWIKGKDVLIINHSNLIGKPLALTLLNYNTSVSIAHEHTKGLAELVARAEIVVTATGQPGILSAEMFSEGAVLIDVTSKKHEGKISGDAVLTEDLIQKLSFYTPVPRGIGPITIACLLRNLIKLNE